MYIIAYLPSSFHVVYLMQHGLRLLMCVTSGYLSTVHRPDNEVVLLHVPEAVGSDADKNSQYSIIIIINIIIISCRHVGTLLSASFLVTIHGSE